MLIVIVTLKKELQMKSIDSNSVSICPLTVIPRSKIRMEWRKRTLHGQDHLSVHWSNLWTGHPRNMRSKIQFVRIVASRNRNSGACVNPNCIYYGDQPDQGYCASMTQGSWMPSHVYGWSKCSTSVQYTEGYTREWHDSQDPRSQTMSCYSGICMWMKRLLYRQIDVAPIHACLPVR